MKAINSDPYAGTLTKLTAPFFILIALSISAPALMAGDRFFTNSIGDFDSASNWQGGLPGGFGNTFIGSSDLGDVRPLPATVNLNTDVTSLQTGRLFLGQGGSGNGILNINSGGSLQYGQVHIGRDGGAVGVLNQNGGTMRVNTGTFEILSGSSGSGTYNLSGGVLNTIAGGAIAIKVGAAGSGTGYFNMSGGTFNAGSDFSTQQHSLNVGWVAKGEATFSGGTANLTGDLNAGNGSNGLVTISGSALVNTRAVNVGLNAGAANSRLTVTGGTLAVTNGIRVANNSVLNVSGGAVTAAGLSIASGSAMTNTGGTLNISAITNNGTLFLDRGNTLAFAGSLSGEGITRIGAGTVLSLESGSAWNGSEIHLDSGAVVRFNGGTGTSTKSLNAFGGTLDVNGQSLPAGSFANFIAHNTGAKLVNSSSSAASIAAGNTIWLLGSSAEIETVGNLEINSVITSALASSVTGITKTGEGTLTLTALNEYTGITTVNQGTLVVVQSTFTATITSTNITVALSNTPSAGNTFAILPGPLQGNYGTPTVNPLSTGQTASFDASTGVLSINQTSNGAAIEDAYPGINATNLASNGLTYLANYAFGGSSVTEAKLPLQDITDPTKLTLVAYVRTNNSSGTLTVTGEKANALNLWDTNNPIPGEPAQDQSDAPSGTEKRIFSTPKSGDRLFLRLKTTLQP